MDQQFQQALDFSKYRQSLAIKRKTLKEKIDAKLTYGCDGGIFKIDRSLINFVQMLIDQDRNKDIPLIDDNGNPVLIKDLINFRDEILDRYFSSVLAYYDEYEKLKKSRTVESLVDL